MFCIDIERQSIRIGKCLVMNLRLDLTRPNLQTAQSYLLMNIENRRCSPVSSPKLGSIIEIKSRRPKADERERVI